MVNTDPTVIEQIPTKDEVKSALDIIQRKLSTAIQERDTTQRPVYNKEVKCKKKLEPNFVCSNCHQNFFEFVCLSTQRKIESFTYLLKQ